VVFIANCSREDQIHLDNMFETKNRWY